jgi:hypothetical protein
MRPMQQCAAAEVWLGSGGCLRVTAPISAQPLRHASVACSGPRDACVGLRPPTDGQMAPP